MPFIPVPDCVSIKIEGRIDNCQTINDLYFRSTIGPRSAADVLALAAALETWVVGYLAPQLNIGWSGIKVAARGLSNVNGLTAESSLAGISGAITGEALPNNVSMAVKFSTGLSGRSNHGRNFVPALSDSIVDGNNIDPDWAVAVVDAYAALIFPSASIPSGWIWVVVSRYLNNEPRAEGVFHEVLSVGVTDLVVDSMRSRLPGRGN